MIIPIDKPVCLKAYTGKSLQNEYHWRRGKCDNENTKAFEQMLIKKTKDDKYIIQSRWNDRNLHVQESGECVFASIEISESAKFEIQVGKDDKVRFISCYKSKRYEM
jgi:hypothetical protein